MPLLNSQGNGHIFIQSTTPTGAITGDIWQDTSTSPPTMKVYDGTNWNQVGSTPAKIIGLG